MNFSDKHPKEPLPRRVEKPGQWQREIKWFMEEFQHPPMSNDLWNVMCQHLVHFRSLIFETGASQMLKQFGSTPDELAVLCGEGSDEWLLTSPIVWALDQLNKTSETTVSLCLNVATVKDLTRLQHRRPIRHMKRLAFVVNVGQDNSGTFIGTSNKSGNHWSLVSVKLDSRCHPQVTYCDTLGWNPPADLAEKLRPFLSFFECGLIQPIMIMSAHVPLQVPGRHRCTPLCMNYPVQVCSNGCGVIALICATISALDTRLFQELTGPRSGTSKQMYLHQPSRYSRYLRRVLMTWFGAGEVNMTFIVPATSMPHCTGPSNTIAGTNNTKKRNIAGANYTKKRNIAGANCTKNSNTVGANCTKNSNTVGANETNTKNSNTVRANDTNTKNSDTAGANDTNTIGTSNINTNPADTSNTNITCTGNTDTAVNSKHTCPYCSITLSRRYVLVRHISRLHPEKPVPTSTFEGGCACIICDTKLCNTKALILHYNSAHKKDFKLKMKSFDNGEEFDTWKRYIEREHMTQFVKQRGSTKSETKCIDFYYCNRSAKGPSPRLVPPHKRKRSERLKGTSKLSSKCTCFMRVTHENGKVSVEYCLDHIGHELELCHLKLSSDLCSFIANEVNGCVDDIDITEPLEVDVESSAPSVHTDIKKYFKPFICRDRVESSNDLRQLRTKALSEAHRVIEFINNANSCEALKSVIDYLVTIMAVGKGHETVNASEKIVSTFEVCEKVAPKKHFESQRSLIKFFSTKRKSKGKRPRFSKPDTEERKLLSEYLNKLKPSKCTYCQLEEDSGTGEEIFWQQCTVCQGWLHANCDDYRGEADYRCPPCRSKNKTQAPVGSTL